jgi:anti-sigma B factor antagonist
MKLELRGDAARITAVRQLAAANANAFRDWIRAELTDGQHNIEVDLSETTFLDSSGLGALVALHKTAQGRGGVLRLIHPQPPVQQLLELTRLDQIFEVIRIQADAAHTGTTRQ